MSQPKKIKLVLTEQDYEHVLAALHYFQQEWDSHGAYQAMRRDVETFSFLPRPLFDDLVKRLELARRERKG